jgi:hypothetical protein
MEQNIFNMSDKLKHIIACAAIATITFNCFSQIPKDKQYHLGAGAFFGVWGTFAGNSCEFTPEKSLLCGIASAMAVGLLKEGADLCGYGTPEWADLGYTVAGGAIGAGLSYVALKIFKKPPLIYVSTDKGLQLGFIYKLNETGNRFK